jgi:hypothetical protein
MRPVARFALSDGDGRFSATWRLWTGDKKPTDEVYVAPRSEAGMFKLSLHSSGYRQLGITAKVRDRHAPSDREAFSRWNGDTQDSLLAVVAFHKSEFQTRPIESKVVVHELAPHEDAVHVLLVTVPELDNPDLPDNSRLIATVERASGFVIAMVVPTQPQPDLILEGRSILEGEGPEWDFGVGDDQPESKLYSWSVLEADGVAVPLIMEIGPPSMPFSRLPREVAAFNGTTHDWAELPVTGGSSQQCCAVIVARDSGDAELYVNLHSRCSHAELAADANRVLGAFRSNGPDIGWDYHAAVAGWVTGIVTQETATRSAAANLGAKQIDVADSPTGAER